VLDVRVSESAVAVKFMVGEPFTSKSGNVWRGPRPAILWLWAIGGESFCEAMGKAYHAGRAIGWIEQHVQEMQLAGIDQSGGESQFEFPLGCDPPANTASDHVADSFIAPLVDVVEWTVKNFPFSGVATIVQHDDDWGLTISHGG
jgi:hypothetical protein